MYRGRCGAIIKVDVRTRSFQNLVLEMLFRNRSVAREFSSTLRAREQKTMGWGLNVMHHDWRFGIAPALYCRGVNPQLLKVS
jgi:hypothetical protein